MIFIKTDVGIDVINCMTIDPKTSYDITDKNANAFGSKLRNCNANDNIRVSP